MLTPSQKRRTERKTARAVADRAAREKLRAEHAAAVAQYEAERARSETEEALAGFTPEQIREAVERECWSRGDLSYLLLPGAQTVAYGAVHAWEDEHPDDAGPVILHMHRGASKSWLLVLLAIERCLRYPGTVARLGSPQLRQTEEVLEPALRYFFERCPKELRPVWEDRSYVFRNARWGNANARSRLCIFGCRENADSQRGLRANWIAVDEVRDLDDAGYVISSVLSPMYVKQTRPLMVLTSTSPATTGHVWWDYVDEAAAAGRYVFMPTTLNPDFSDKDRKVLLGICKGENTPAWRREALCERVADTNLLAVPSFSAHKEAIVQEQSRPDEFYTFTIADLGFVDPTAVLFAYANYLTRQIVVEDEIVGSSINTSTLIAAVKKKEKELWERSGMLANVQRWADCTPRERSDLAHAGLYMSPAKQGDWDKWRGLAYLDSCFYQGTVIIHPRCKNLIHQLGNAVKNTHQTDLKREKPPEYRDPNSPIMGHADALWALAYLVERARYYTTIPPYLSNQRRGFSSVQGDEGMLLTRPVNIGFSETSLG
jgi:hypothetical protein